MPHRTLDDRIDGIVITFTDITFQKAEEALVMKIDTDDYLNQLKMVF
jgi:hypothetical protein